MPEKQGSLALLNDPKAQELIHAPIMAHLAYVTSNGTPRVMPVWFAWEHGEVVICSVAVAKKLKLLTDGAQVAIDISEDHWPYHRLQLRGTVSTSSFPGVVPGYKDTATRYLGDPFGSRFVGQFEQMGMPMTRIAVRPDWVGLYDFESRNPGQS
jgi:hypothetical protein